MAITRTAMVDDDGSGTTGTIINNAWKTELYNQIDAADAGAGGITSGTWLPTLQGDAGVTGQTYGTRTGYWTRIGNQLLVSGTITLTAKGTLSGGALAIGNLPVASAGPGTIQIAYFAALGTPVVHIGAYVQGTSAYLVYTAAAAVATGNLTPAHCTDTTTLIFSGAYTV